MRTTAVTATAATKRPAARAPSRAATIAARTGTASQAVDFRSQAAPSATPEPVIAVIHEVRPGRRGRRGPRGQGQGQQDQRQHRRVGGDHGQVEPHHRRGHGDRGGEQRVVGPGPHHDPERRGERDHRADRDPHPGVARQAAEAGRARQAEQGHDREVGVVGQPGGDLVGGQVGRPVVQQQGRRPVDDHHPVFERVGDRQPEQRREHGQRHRDADGGHPAPAAAPAPQHDQGHGVAAGGPDGPDPVPAAGQEGSGGRVRSERAVGGHQVTPAEPAPRGRGGILGTGPPATGRPVSCAYRVSWVPR